MPRPDDHDPFLADRRRVLAVLGGLSAGVFMMGCSSDDGDDTSRGGVPSTTTSATGTTVDPVAGDPYVQAFFAGVPLVTTLRTMQTFAPLTKINQAFVSPGLTQASTRLVIAPNHDTVYVLAVLDLDAGPIRIDLPAIADRYQRTWQTTLDELAAAGKLRNAAPPVRQFLFGMLNWSRQWYRPDGALSLDELTDSVLVMLGVSTPATNP